MTEITLRELADMGLRGRDILYGDCERCGYLRGPIKRLVLGNSFLTIYCDWLAEYTKEGYSMLHSGEPSVKAALTEWPTIQYGRNEEIICPRTQSREAIAILVLGDNLDILKVANRLQLVST